MQCFVVTMTSEVGTEDRPGRNLHHECSFALRARPSPTPSRQTSAGPPSNASTTARAPSESARRALALRELHIPLAADKREPGRRVLGPPRGRPLQTNAGQPDWESSSGGGHDGQEREFRGFGLVETWDTEGFEDFNSTGLFTFEQFETVEENLHQPPVYTKSWFHTGAFIGRKKLSKLFADEYWSGDEDAWSVPDSAVPSGLSGRDAREAVRALAGRTLRTEVYALDGSEAEDKPYTVTEATFEIRRLQARGPNRHGVYLAHDREALSYHYERAQRPDPNPANDPHLDPRIAHSFTLDVDDYGTVLRSAAVVYPHRDVGYTDPDEQRQLYVTLSEADVVHLDGTNGVLRLAVPTETRSYELHGLAAPSQAAFTFAALLDAADTATEIAYTATPTGTGSEEKRLLARNRTRYLADDLSAPLLHGSVESKALPYDSEAMAMTEAQRVAVFGGLTHGAPTNTELENEGKYILDDSAWWVRTGHPTYDASKFYAVTSVDDPYGNVYSTTYDSHSLLTVGSSDPVGNTVTAAHDYRLLAPWQLTDPNGNRSQVAFDILGFVSKTAIMGKVGDSDGDTLADPIPAGATRGHGRTQSPGGIQDHVQQ